MAKNKNKYDWEAIWRDYRAGALSIAEVSRRHGIDRAYMSRKAKALGVTRDLSERVKQAVETKLVSGFVSSSESTEDDIVNETSDEVVNVVHIHRKTIQKGREVVDVLMGQLVDAANNREGVEEEIGKESSSRNRYIMKKAVSLQSQASIATNLSNALKNFITLDRQAYSLDTTGDGGKSFSAEEVINKRHEELKS